MMQVNNNHGRTNKIGFSGVKINEAEQKDVVAFLRRHCPETSDFIEVRPCGESDRVELSANCTHKGTAEALWGAYLEVGGFATELTEEALKIPKMAINAFKQAARAKTGIGSGETAHGIMRPGHRT